MDSWHATFLGIRHLPREVTAFEIEVFFQFSAEEARIIEERRRPELKLGLALRIGFLRMSGRLLDAVRMVPPLLWRHLGERFSVAAPDLASLRAMYRRAPTLIEHQQLACDALGFQWLTGHHRRALVRVLRQELSRTDDRERLLGFARRWLYEHQLLSWRAAPTAKSADSRPASCAELIRARLIDGVRPVRSLLSALVRLPWAATDNHPVLEALRRLQGATPTSSANYPLARRSSSAASRRRPSPAPTANGRSAPSKSRLYSPCDAPFAMGPSGSTTASRFAVGSGCSSRPTAGLRSAAPISAA
jgi:hypothetical protein